MISDNKGKAFDPRHFYIKVRKIILSEDLKHFKNYDLKMEIGTKHSNTDFKIQDLSTREGEEKFQQEAHIFQYDGCEILTLTLSQSTDDVEEEHLKEKKIEKQEEKKEGKSLKKIDKHKKLSGYSKILLTPLIEYPHTKHIIKADLIGLKSDMSIDHQKIGGIDIQFHFRLDFVGTLEIIPLSADLQKNVAKVGEMAPFISLNIENQSWTSQKAEESGIHPKWSGYYKSHYVEGKRQPINKKKKSHRKQQQKNEESNLELYWSQTNEWLFEFATFKLRSAGSELKISVLTKPLIGLTPDLAGHSILKIENEGFFLIPERESDDFFQKKSIELKMKDPINLEDDAQITVGTLSLLIRFIYNKDKVVNPPQVQMELA